MIKLNFHRQFFKTYSGISMFKERSPLSSWAQIIKSHRGSFLVILGCLGLVWLFESIFQFQLITNTELFGRVKICKEFLLHWSDIGLPQNSVGALRANSFCRLFPSWQQFGELEITPQILSGGEICCHYVKQTLEGRRPIIHQKLGSTCKILLNRAGKSFRQGYGQKEKECKCFFILRLYLTTKLRQRIYKFMCPQKCKKQLVFTGSGIDFHTYWLSSTLYTYLG